MFRWLTGKNREPTRGERFARAFDMNLPELVHMLVARLKNEASVERAMLLVAFANIRAELKINRSVEKSYASGLPKTYAAHGRMVALQFDDFPMSGPEARSVHDIRFRRLHHLFRACVLGAVSEKAHQEKAELENVADLWGEYLASAGSISSIAQQSRIWSEDELEWFGADPDHGSQISATLCAVVPGFLWRHDAMLQMAKSRFGVVANALKPFVHESI
jgi:hypothetical protein